jgi:Flp pilus assembly protein TadD
MRSVFAVACACWLLVGCTGRPASQAPAELTASSRLNVALAAEESGDRNTAAGMYLAAAEDAAGDAGVQVQCAEGLARTGRLEEAQALLERRVKGGLHDANVLRTLGAVQAMAGHASVAVQTLSAALSARPDDGRAMVDKAVALDMLQQHDEAQGLYRQALALAPGDLTISNNLALSLLLSGRAAEAATVLAPFRNNAGLPERMKTNLGIVAAASGNTADAQAMLGQRIGASDLAMLTGAINRGGAARP